MTLKAVLWIPSLPNSAASAAAYTHISFAMHLQPYHIKRDREKKGEKCRCFRKSKEFYTRSVAEKRKRERGKNKNTKTKKQNKTKRERKWTSLNFSSLDRAKHANIQLRSDEILLLFPIPSIRCRIKILKIYIYSFTFPIYPSNQREAKERQKQRVRTNQHLFREKVFHDRLVAEKVTERGETRKKKQTNSFHLLVRGSSNVQTFAKLRRILSPFLIPPIKIA